MKHRIFLLLVAFICVNSISAQDLSWKKHKKLAEELFDQSKYEEAGEHYFAAWKQKQKKDELAFLAGECFYNIKDYRRAAEAYQYVKESNDEFDKVGLKYARSLKQSGNFEDAKREFVYFMNDYKGPDAQGIIEVVQNEIKGCELAKDLEDAIVDEDIELQYMGESVNSPAIEYAPIPFANDILYFSSNVDGFSKVYRTQRIEGVWSPPSLSSNNFKGIEKEHFGNGCFTPDSRKFYFTQCEGMEGQMAQCEIYVMENKGQRWTKPRRLPDYVNDPGAMTTTQPYVVHDGDKEILYFVSDRDGSLGGLDIWYSEKKIDSKSNDFTFPRNLGNKVNTPGNEVTPFYNLAERTLYFSSDGQVGIGGLDIYAIKGSINNWDKPKNIGKPFNSHCDDWYYIKQLDGDGGFLVSNRIWGMEKIKTTDEDLFHFETKKIQMQVSGGVFDVADKRAPIRNIKVSLYEITLDDQKRLLHTNEFSDGQYEFGLLPDRQYRVVAEKDGYSESFFNFETKQSNVSEYGEDIYLSKLQTVVETSAPVYKEPEPVYSQPTTRPTPQLQQPTNRYNNQQPDNVRQPVRQQPQPKVEQPVRQQPRVVQQPKPQPRVVQQPQPRTQPTYTPPVRQTMSHSYKVQIIAMKTVNMRRYNKVADIGAISTEYIPEKDLYRVLIGEYPSLRDANRAMAKLKKRGYGRAYVVKYINGLRDRRIFQ